MRLGVLDYAPIDDGGDAHAALGASTRLAREAERLGFERYWVSEHHGVGALASVSPEVVMAHLASSTTTIRVGSGGVMLPHYSSMKVAENYQSLEALHPGRIDLGFGRAPGADRRVTLALNDEKAGVLPYEDKVADLVGFLTGDHLAGSEYSGLTAAPATTAPPTPWVLGASGSTASLAGAHGLGFTFAHFINASSRGVTAVEQYRRSFEPSAFLTAPAVIVAVFVAVGETYAEAAELADAFHLWLAHAESAKPFDRLPTMDAVRNHRWTSAELEVRARNEGRLISGTGPAVIEQLEALAAAYGTDEVMVNPMLPGEATRTATLGRLAHAVARTSRRAA